MAPDTDPANVPIPQEETHTKHENNKDTETLLSEYNHLVDRATLEQRYNRLNKRHEELHKLCSVYIDVICGSSSPEKQSVNIEQLRAEAGCEGMRAKALQADVLKPILREAGGLQALVSQMEAIRQLIAKVGGIQELEDLVSEMHLVQIGLNKVGGLQGLYDLIAEAKRLREEQLDTRARVEGPNGLAEKAVHYDRLVRAFNEVHAQREHVAPVGHVASAGTATMNPARASLIASMPLEYDPYRDLYEAPPVEQPRNKTGSNKVPLGHPHARKRPSRWVSKEPSVKQESMDDIDMQETTNKRPRIDSGHSSAMMHISRTPSLNEEPALESPYQLPEYETRCKKRMRY